MSEKMADDFLMSPMVDYCFKELLAYPTVRKGFLAAILNRDPSEIGSTELLPTILEKETEEGKYGILDVRIRMKDGSQIDLEMQVVPFAFWERWILFYLSRMYTEQIKAGENYGEMKRCIHVSILNFIHFPEDQICFREIALCDLQTKKKYTDLLEIYVLELKKLPPEQLKEPMIIQWMRFLSAQKKEDFEKMAEKDGYIGEAYGVLKKLSADEQKRLEYEARQKAILDYNSQVIGYTEKGVQMGEERLGRLCEALMDAGRMEDLKKAVSNEEYRKELYQEFDIL